MWLISRSSDSKRISLLERVLSGRALWLELQMRKAMSASVTDGKKASASAQMSTWGMLVIFVHEFRPLAATEVYDLLDRRWAPPGVCLPQQPLDAEIVAAIIRITGGNFRLLVCSRRWNEFSKLTRCRR